MSHPSLREGWGPPGSIAPDAIAMAGFSQSHVSKARHGAPTSYLALKLLCHFDRSPRSGRSGETCGCFVCRKTAGSSTRCRSLGMTRCFGCGHFSHSFFFSPTQAKGSLEWGTALTSHPSLRLRMGHPVCSGPMSQMRDMGPPGCCGGSGEISGCLIPGRRPAMSRSCPSAVAGAAGRARWAQCHAGSHPCAGPVFLRLL